MDPQGWSQQPPWWSQQPPWWSQQPPWWSQQPPWWSQQPPWWSQQPPWWSQQPPWWSQQPPWWSHQPPFLYKIRCFKLISAMLFIYMCALLSKKKIQHNHQFINVIEILLAGQFHARVNQHVSFRNCFNCGK